MGWMAFVTIFVFIMWMYQVRLLMALFLGINASYSSLQQFISTVLTTNEGLMFLVIGNLVGGALSLVLFSLTVVSFPLLLDRDDVDCVTAMITSVRAVVTNPGPMIGWAAVIVVLMIVSALPFFGAAADAADTRPCDVAPLSPHQCTADPCRERELEPFRL